MTTRDTTVRLTVADNFSTQLRAFATALDQSEKAVKSTSKQMGIFGQANKQLADGVKSGATMALASIPFVAAAAGGAVIKLGMDMEQTRVAFTTLTGSADLANKHLQELRDFAKSTPFQFTELTDASKKMQAFGFATKDVVPMMTDIGDAVSALGAGSQGIDSVVRALGQMQAKGKVSAEEMNQLTEVGIAGWKYIAAGVGKTTAEVMKMSEKGLIPAGDAIQYILKGMREDFGGGMAAQSKTAAGQLSNLIDSLTEVATTIGEMVLPVVTEVIKKFGEFANTLKEGVTLIPNIIAMDVKLKDAVKGVGAELVKTTNNYTDYRDGVLGAAETAGFFTEEEVRQIKAGEELSETTANMMAELGIFTEGMYTATGGMLQQEQALRANMAAMNELNVVVQEHSKILAPSELGMLALAEASRAGGDAQKDFTKWIKESTEAQAGAREDIANSIASYDNLAKSLAGAADAEAKKALASVALAGLKQAYEDGTISQEDFYKASDQVLLRYDMATPRSLAMADAQRQVDSAFIEGNLPINDYITAADKIPKIADDGKVSLDELKTLGIMPTTQAIKDQKKSIDDIPLAWSKVPKEYKTVYTIEVKGEVPSTPHQEQRARGGPVMAGRTYLVGEGGPETLVMGRNGGGYVIPNENNYNFNMNVYTQDAASPIREFGLMQALAGAQ